MVQQGLQLLLLVDLKIVSVMFGSVSLSSVFHVGMSLDGETSSDMSIVC